jgi:penicillin-binding protein 1A
VKLMIDIGRSAIINTAHMAGIKGELETWAPMVLGTSALSLMDLTTGYIPFASGGFPATPYAVLEIRRSNGDALYQRDGDSIMAPRRVFPEEKVAELNTMLSAVVKSGTGRRADLRFTPQGGKTGTNQGYRDAWYIGYTGHFVTGVWYGNDDFTPMKEVTGGLIPAPTWKRIMMEAERGLRPIGIAGVPYDETYAAAAAELPGAVSEPLPSDEREQAAGAATASAEGEDEDVNSVLTGMFDLFEAAPSAAAVAAATAKAKASKKKASQEALVLPKANVQPENRKKKRRLMEQIFGGDDEDASSQPKRKKKKKKTLFDSIF